MPYRSRSYSRSRSPSPRRGRYRDNSPLRREPANRCSLLIRNLSKDTRVDDLRYQAEKYGRVRDVYLPKDYYTGEARGMGFIEYTNPRDAEEAKYGLDRLIFAGREISVVFAQQGRKRPEEYRRAGYRRNGGGNRGGSRYGRSRSPRRSPPRRRSRSLSPRRSDSKSRSRSPRRGRDTARSPSRSRSPQRDSRSPPPSAGGPGSPPQPLEGDGSPVNVRRASRSPSPRSSDRE